LIHCLAVGIIFIVAKLAISQLRQFFLRGIANETPYESRGVEGDYCILMTILAVASLIALIKGVPADFFNPQAE